MTQIVVLRSREQIEYPVPERDGLDYFHEDAERLLPEGYELIALARARGVAIARSREVREIRIEDPAEVWTCAPEGWQVMSTRPE